jgi:hypothetical protein
VNDIIFLTQHQKKILDEENVGVKTLTLKALRECVTATDYRSILDQTLTMRQRGGLLDRFGFGCSAGEGDMPVPDGNQDGGTKAYVSAFDWCSTQLNAACPCNDCIVIWEESSTSNDMLRQSFYNILSAMSAVLAFEDLKGSKQFELCILQNI